MSSPSSSAAVGASSFSIFGDCTICLSDLTPSNTYAITKCGHTFHGKCIQKWLKSALSCPTCRTKAKKSKLIKLFFNGKSNDSITNEENSVAEKDSGDTLSVNRENNSQASEDSSEDETDSDDDAEDSMDNDAVSEALSELRAQIVAVLNRYGSRRFSELLE
uniref:RING-type domain-containing protein n=1 Tax=Panagrolaimus davidi TaxID=227884 RepID=A0A914PPP1_9BILA